MKLTLNPNGFTAKLWRSTYNNRLPQSLCPYFWTTILAYILAIPSWPGHLINFIQRKSDYSGDKIAAYWSAFHVPFCLGVGASIIDATDKTPIYHAYLAGILLLVMIGVLFLFVGFCVAATMHFKEVYQEYKQRKMFEKGLTDEEGRLLDRERAEARVKRSNIIREYTKAFLGKYCPKIEWKSDAK